jgi:hypothetical protein
MIHKAPEFFGLVREVVSGNIRVKYLVVKGTFPRPRKARFCRLSRRPKLLTNVDRLLDSKTTWIIAGLPKKPVHALATSRRILEKLFTI